MNLCIERKGWKQVRSPQEQEQIRDAVASEAARTAPSESTQDPHTTQAFVQAVEENLGVPPSTVPGRAKKDRPGLPDVNICDETAVTNLHRLYSGLTQAQGKSDGVVASLGGALPALGDFAVEIGTPRECVGKENGN